MNPSKYFNLVRKRWPETSVCYGQALYMPPVTEITQDNLSGIKEHLLALPWQTKRTARHECFMSNMKISYSYGGKAKCLECQGTGNYRGPAFGSLVDCEHCGGTGEVGAYNAIPMTEIVRVLGLCAQTTASCDFNACFLNKYDDQHQHLGWHADNFEGMDPKAPIAVMSFGAEREIWLKDKRGFECLKCGGSGCLPVSEAEGAANGYPICDCGGQGFTSAPPNGRQPANQRVKLEETSLFIMPPGYQENYFHRIPKHDRPCGWRISLTFRKFF